MSKGDPEFERFDSIVRKAFSVPHNEIVRREKQYQQKRKRAKQKRVKTSPAMMAAALWQNDNLSFWQLFPHVQPPALMSGSDMWVPDAQSCCICRRLVHG